MTKRPLKQPFVARPGTTSRANIGDEAVIVAARVMSDTGVSRVDSSVTWQIDTRFAVRVPLFGYFAGRRHATRGDHDDATKDNRGAL